MHTANTGCLFQKYNERASDFKEVIPNWPPVRIRRPASGTVPIPYQVVEHGPMRLYAHRPLQSRTRGAMSTVENTTQIVNNVLKNIVNSCSYQGHDWQPTIIVGYFLCQRCHKLAACDCFVKLVLTQLVAGV
jgi:hypothetical protein